MNNITLEDDEGIEHTFDIPNDAKASKPASDDLLIAEALQLLCKIESAAHGYCDGARLSGKSKPGIRQIAEWAAEAQRLLTTNSEVFWYDQTY